MVRIRCYNDLLRLRRPKIDEDGLEILSAGTAAAALASVSSALATSVPEAAPEAEPVASAEPAAAAEPAPSFEPEPVFAMNAQGQALSEIESEFAAGFEYGQGARPVPEPMREEAEKSVTELEPLPAMSSAEEEEITPVPYEISESVKNLILRKMETDEELLEEAFFVKRISKRMSDKPDGAAAKKREGRSIRTERAGRVQTGRPSPSVRNRKSRRKREEGMVKAAVIAAAGLGAFIVGRVTKGGD